MQILRFYLVRVLSLTHRLNTKPSILLIDLNQSWCKPLLFSTFFRHKSPWGYFLHQIISISYFRWVSKLSQFASHALYSIVCSTGNNPNSCDEIRGGSIQHNQPVCSYEISIWHKAYQ